MKRYEYEAVKVSHVRTTQELMDILNTRGKQGWRRVDADLGHVLFERELPEDEPGSDDTSGPVTLNENVPFYTPEPQAANTDITH
jgi:hypothetical protein